MTETKNARRILIAAIASSIEQGQYAINSMGASVPTGTRVPSIYISIFASRISARVLSIIWTVCPVRIVWEISIISPLRLLSTTYIILMIYTHGHTHTHTHTYIHIHPYIHTHKHTHIHIYIYIYIYIYISIYHHLDLSLLRYTNTTIYKHLKINTSRYIIISIYTNLDIS